MPYQPQPPCLIPLTIIHPYSLGAAVIALLVALPLLPTIQTQVFPFNHLWRFLHNLLRFRKYELNVTGVGHVGIDLSIAKTVR